MNNKKFISFEEAANFIKDGDTVTVCGCENLLVPERMLKAVESRFLSTGHPKNLTTFYPIIHGMEIGMGLENFAHEGMIDTVIGSSFSYLKTSRMTKMLLNNEIKGHLMPMGTAYRILQNRASNESFTLTDVGMGTFVDPRVEGGRMNQATTESLAKLITVGGKELLCYENPMINVAIIRGTTADENGNISLEEEPVKLGIASIAMAAKASGGKVIVQVKRVAKGGSLHPKSVVVPGLFVDAVVVDEQQYTTGGDIINPALTGEIKMPLNAIEALPIDIKKVILSRAADEVTSNHKIINLGVGMPVGIPNILVEQGRFEGKTFFPEHGSVGGVLGERGIFGANINPEAIIDSIEVFMAFRGGSLDISFLGCAQIDRYGNVNVSKFNNVVSGCGGFIDIAYRTPTLVFCGTFSAGGLDIEVVNGKLNIKKEGKYSKFVNDVEQITLSGRDSVKKGQKVIYVTERAVFALKEDGLHLVEVAEGINIEKDILAYIPFDIVIDPEVKLMDKKHFL